MSLLLKSPVEERVWPRVRVGDVLTLINGRAFKPSEWSDSGRPIIRIQNLNNPSASFNYHEGDLPSKFLVRDGDLLFAWSGTPGTSFGAHIWKGGEAWLNQHIFKVLFEEALFDRRFLQFAINQNLEEYIRAAHGGAGLAHITKGKFEASELPIPPIEEQWEIVAEIETQLSRLEAGVSALKRAQANLKRYRAAVLKAACEGRLVPTEAELASAEDRDYETGSQLLARAGQKVQNKIDPVKSAQRDVDQRINTWPLPDGWVWTTIGQAFYVGVGATPSRAVASFWGGGIPWVSSGEVAFCRISKTRETITLEGLTKASTQLHPPGTVLIGMIGEGKTRGQVALLDIEACNNQNSAAIRVSATGMPAEYVYYYLWGQYEANRRIASGNNQPALNKSRIQAMALPLPPLAEQKRIVAEVERRLSVVDELEATVAANLRRAARLRQAVLAAAFDPKGR